MVRRASAAILMVLVLAISTVSFSVLTPSAVQAVPAAGVPAQAPDNVCSTEEWQRGWQACVSKMQDVAESEVRCLEPPTAGTPDSGLAGWFADKPDSAAVSGVVGLSTQYGYTGYTFKTYDEGCGAGLVNADGTVSTMLANGEFMLATSILGASNALRQRAWDPETMWSWADPLVDQATKAVYQEVFSVFGVITLLVIGVYLLWRSRQADMSNAVTTVGWAVLVMAAVTALAAWPVKSANLADDTLITGLSVVHDAVGPRPVQPEPGRCLSADTTRCRDNRPPAVRASDTATETMLYRNWLRGVLGSADSETAKKYGRALYDAKAMTWSQAADARADATRRTSLLEDKRQQWMKVAKQIQTEDPEAYEYLQGANGMDRIGSGFIALLATFLFAMFDLTASVLVLLGFLIFRWAVIAAPILGTIGLLRPASSGIRRLGNVVVAAVFNIVIFGTGAAIYLFAVDLIMNTASLAGWLQVMLIWLCGVVGWLLLRPYRRITQLGGKDNSEAVASGGSWHRRFFRDLREAAKLDPAEPGGTREPAFGRGRVLEQTSLRPESRREDPAHATRSREVTSEPATAPDAPAARPDGVERTAPAVESAPAAAPTAADERQTRQGAQRELTWTSPDVPDEQPQFVIYRPGPARPSTPEPERPRIRSEAR
jgi:hypothetical protein